AGPRPPPPRAGMPRAPPPRAGPAHARARTGHCRPGPARPPGHCRGSGHGAARSPGARPAASVPAPPRSCRTPLGHPEVDLGAVLPEPLQLVELTLLVVLDVHDDVAEVEQHPAAVPLPLAADRLGADLTQPVLHLVDDGADLAVAGRGDDDEGIGERQLLADVDTGDGGGELLVRRGSGGAGELEGTV